jgi:two-component system chemotaxis response regulator CheB
MTPEPTETRKIHVMIVDDSAVIRSIYRRFLSEDPDIKIVAVAENGRLGVEALNDKALADSIDIIILDVEMPEMDGLTALPELKKRAVNAHVIMSSTLTQRSANVTMRAMSLGASDYVAKPGAIPGSDQKEAFCHEIIGKVKVWAGKRARNTAPSSPATPTTTQAVATATAPTPPAARPVIATPKVEFTLRKAPFTPPKALAIGGSTGAPQALITLFTALHGRLPNIPIFITQHMPPIFTGLLAQNIEKACGRSCKEAQHEEPVDPHSIYVAPGDHHMQVGGSPVLRLKVTQDPPVNFCRPAVDPMLASLSTAYGSALLTVILTGMGSDGLTGCRQVTQHGGTVIAQDQETSVVWGMPGVVTKDGLCSAVLPLEALAPKIVELCHARG